MRFLSLTLLLLAFSCGSPKATIQEATEQKTYLGDWDIIVENTPLGTVEGVVTLTEKDEAITGIIRVDDQEFPLKFVRTEEDKLRTSFYYSNQGVDVPIEVDGAADADVLTGYAMYEYKTTFTRKK